MKKATRLKLIFSLLTIFVAVSFSSAQTAHTLSKNSQERKDILDVLKMRIDADGEKNAIVSPYFFKVSEDWAYLSGVPKRNATVEEDTYNVKALLKKSDGKWNVVKYLVGSNDLSYIGWDKEFNDPKGIFPKAVRASGKRN